MSWVFGLSEYDVDSDSGDMLGRPHGILNPPAIAQTVEEDADAPVRKFGSFRVGNQRIKKVSLRTPLKPDHSYNGVSFNVAVKHKVDSWVFVTGFEASGILRKISIFKLFGKDVNRHAHHGNEWVLIHRKVYPKSWKSVTVLQLEKPVRIGPGETCGFYIHSNCENDMGLKYRSCMPGVVLEDSCICVSHGWAHTSCIPFDRTRGWIRNHRVLSGSIFYQPIPLRWSPDRNVIWQDKSPTYQLALDAVMSSTYFSTGILVELMTFCGIDWFNRNVGCNEDGDVVNESRVKGSAINQQLAYQPRRSSMTMRSMIHQLNVTVNGLFRSQSARSAPVVHLPQPVEPLPQQVDDDETSETPFEVKDTQSDTDEFDNLQIFFMDKKSNI